MLFHDVFSIYLVSLEKPFLFFDSPFLEAVCFWAIMLGDFIYDGIVILIFVFVTIGVSFGGEEYGFWVFLLIVSMITFCIDVYQAFLYLNQYDQGELTEE